MTINQVFNIQTIFSLVMFGVLMAWYIWPKLRTQSYYKILTALLVFSAFRYLGTSFIVPNMTDGLSLEFAGLGAWADLVLAVIALVAAIMLRRNSSSGIFFAWIYTVLGSADFIYNGSRIGSLGVAEHIGPLMWLMTVLGPAWMVTIFFLWKILLKPVNKNI